MGHVVRMGEVFRGIWSGCPKARDPWEDPVVCAMIILKWNLGRYYRWATFTQLA
jgi:hypothetical protein